MKPLTTEQFIEKAQEIHNGQYDYSLVNYINSKAKVEIVCKEHGSFWQTPYGHLRGQKCPYCQNRAKLTTSQFIERAQEIHKDLYDYSLVEYIDNKTKIKIVCKLHGAFEINPNSHLSGCGCPLCNRKKPLLTQTQFIEKARAVHKELYDYSKVQYQSNRHKVEIICKLHGSFWQTPTDHLRGRGCNQCGKKSNFNFIQKAQQTHKGLYDYSEVNYINIKTKVEIICKTHGSFWQIPENHLRGQKCPYCQNRAKLTTEQFIERAQQVHKELYDYSKVNYLNSTTKVEIICKEHGSFWQSPLSHLGGHGCPVHNRRNKWTQQEIIDKFNEIHCSRYSYSLVQFKNVSTKIKIICNTHGVFEQTPDCHLQGQGCPKCKQSFGERTIQAILDSNNISYIEQKTFDDLKDKIKLRYDFFISEWNLLIEYNGSQHYNKNAFHHTRKEFLKQKHHDWLKRHYARKNGFNFLCITYKDNISEMLNVYLKKNTP